MRDPKRIDRILELIRQEWEKYPDQRLGQLLENMYGQPVEYYTEDDKFETTVKLKGGIMTAEQVSDVLAKEDANRKAAWDYFFQTEMPKVVDDILKGKNGKNRNRR